MFEELAELVIGPLGVATVLVYAAAQTDSGHSALRKAARGVLKACYVVSQKASAAFEELKEEADDLVAEVKAERVANNGERSSSPAKKTAKPGRDG